MCCTEVFVDFLSMVVGVKNTSLVSDMRPIDNVDYDAPFELITNT